MSKGDRSSSASSLRKLQSITGLVNYGNAPSSSHSNSNQSEQKSNSPSITNSKPNTPEPTAKQLIAAEVLREPGANKPFNIETITDKPRSSSWTFWKNEGKNTTRSKSPNIHESSSLNPNSTSTRQQEPVLDAEQPAKRVKLKSSYNSLRSNNSIQTDKESKEKPDESWLNWKKLSRGSISNFIYNDTQESPLSSPQLGPSGSEDVKTGSAAAPPPTTVNNEESTNPADPKPLKQNQWNFWNSPANSDAPDNLKPQKILTNTIFSSEDAVIFEPHQSKEVESTININKDKNIKENEIVPSFNECLPYYSATSSIYNNLHKISHKLGIAQSDPKYLYRINSKPVKNVLIIGVHGFFPTRMIRPLIGEPTGTSLRFANEAEKAVLRYAKEENWVVSIQKIALEKEGKIFDRVDFFYDILIKWVKEINNADFIFIAAHSQGCPVSILLLSKLIENGFVNANKKIGILAMAGINNGPFYGVDQKFFVKAYSTIENLSMGELFEFQNFNSLQSKRFLESLRIVIRHNVKITFIGSINDQLVPLYSSICSHIKHPNIFRATYIDGSSGTPDFVTRLVSIANHLNNVGSTDHGIIKEVSGILAGPLTGGGHSKIYNDGKVYDMGIRFALNTNDLSYELPVKFKEFNISKLGTNPYHLPWCMRGLMFETVNYLPNGNEEIRKLFEEFENWKPDSKPLKDMKYRLNAIKAKL